VIATGGKPTRPDIPGAHLGIDSDGFFELKTLPQKVIIMGAGYIGVEIAGVLNTLGSDVSQAFRGDKLMRGFDEDIRDHLQQQMTSEGIRLLSGHQPSQLETVDSQIKVTWQDGSNEMVDCFIWATGRIPNTAGLDLEKADIKATAKGLIEVDENQHTSVPHIYALGDIIGEIDLTPVAIATGRKLAARLYQNQTATQDFDLVPTVVFSHPPIGTIGLSEQQAKQQYGDKDIAIYQSTFTPMVYALSEHKVPTLMKVICQGENQRVVGLHIVGKDADEMLQGFGVAIKMKATKADLDNCVAIHPTSSEELVTLR
jgi:glutathione reductase (NADPH)